MHLRKGILFFVFLVTTLGFAQAVELSPLSKISVLTSGPGDMLYSAFGHSAFRVKDTSLGIDVVYNYGVFDTSGENFYLKFARGRMDYKLERSRFEYYLRGYEIENRWVKEQVLNLSLQERNRIFQFLEKNNLPENKIYAYDYFSNNCATKIWDVLDAGLGEKLVFKEDYLEERSSFRQLVHDNIRINSWGAFGIDLALGSVIDRKATAKEHLYLPEYVMRQLRLATINKSPIAVAPTILNETVPRKAETRFFSSPLFVTLLLAMLVLAITYSDFKKRKRTLGLDFIILFSTGLIGVFMCFLWFFTDHLWTVNNYNILWAVPLNLVAAFVMLRRQPAVYSAKYFILLLGLLGLGLLLAILKVQFFSPVLLPLMVALAIRYYYLILFTKNTYQTKK